MARESSMEVLEAMYPELVRKSSENFSFSLNLEVCNNEYSPKLSISVNITLPDGYPGAGLSCTIYGGLGSKAAEQRLSQAVRKFVSERVGDKDGGGEEDVDDMLVVDVIAFLRGEEGGGVEDIYRDVLRSEEERKGGEDTEVMLSAAVALAAAAAEQEVEWFHSEQIVSKGSVFVASGIKIRDAQDVVPLVEFHSKKDSRHRKATHHMYAYRILMGGVLYHDNSDDGEDGAGRKIAELLNNMMKAGEEQGEERGVLMIVSRWYGGVKLGPKRFAHIANAAREVMCKMFELGGK
ncbi:hypothetical protein TrCOL_g13846 [Triparma columacea]|uniref:Uncharacterized protein n=1 Tax=Triparma columacea TaxID=722753 RepID=A0A9W7L5P4_9STRA|nr:hypothetical protein TrCOL_g13846 [Triparma columacea]